MFNAVGHHIHGAYAEHGAVHIITVKHARHEVFTFGLISVDFLPVVGLEEFSCLYQESRGAARGIANSIGWGGAHELYHQTDDMPRSAELPVYSGRGKLGEQVLIDIPTGVGKKYMA